MWSLTFYKDSLELRMIFEIRNNDKRSIFLHQWPWHFRRSWQKAGCTSQQPRPWKKATLTWTYNRSRSHGCHWQSVSSPRSMSSPSLLLLLVVSVSPRLVSPLGQYPHAGQCAPPDWFPPGQCSPSKSVFPPAQCPPLHHSSFYFVLISCLLLNQLDIFNIFVFTAGLFVISLFHFLITAVEFMILLFNLMQSSLT